MKLDDEILAQIGIKNPLHRMQLINARNDLLAQQEQDTASPVASPTQLLQSPGSRNGSPATASKPASPAPSMGTISPRVNPNTDTALHVLIMLQSKGYVEHASPGQSLHI